VLNSLADQALKQGKMWNSPPKLSAWSNSPVRGITLCFSMHTDRDTGGILKLLMNTMAFALFDQGYAFFFLERERDLRA
jgi:hypothetical protein